MSAKSAAKKGATSKAAPKAAAVKAPAAAAAISVQGVRRRHGCDRVVRFFWRN